jgi:hypothetical protein
VKPAASYVIADLAQGNAADPGPELLILSQTVELHENRQQRLLYDIVGCVGIKYRPQDKRIHPLANNNGQLLRADPAARASLT